MEVYDGELEGWEDVDGAGGEGLQICLLKTIVNFLFILYSLQKLLLFQARNGSRIQQKLLFSLKWFTFISYFEHFTYIVIRFFRGVYRPRGGLFWTLPRLLRGIVVFLEYVDAF